MQKRLVTAILLFAIPLALPKHGQGIYLCQDAEGRQVLTDRPAQLKACTVMDLSSPPAPESRRPPSPPGPSPTPPVPGDSVESAGKPRAGSPENVTTIPVQRVGHLFLVTVRMSGDNGDSDARLIVDTGASHTIVSHKLALDLGLYSDSRSGTVTMNTVGGTVQAPLARIKAIRIGEAEVTNSFVVIHDLPDSPSGVEGLLGLSALQHFQVTLDPNKSVLLLQPSTP